jgi:hypothetical protein
MSRNEGPSTALPGRIMGYISFSGGAPQPSMPHCQHCGAHVTGDFTRVFGNNDDEVYGCLECHLVQELVNGDARRRGEPARPPSRN